MPGDPQEVARIATLLTTSETKILHECAGYLPPSPWGAWVGACLETLHSLKLVRSERGGITELGHAVADFLHTEKSK